MKKVFFPLIFTILFLAVTSETIFAQQGFREGIPITIKKEDGTVLKGTLISFTGEFTMTTEIGFKAKIRLNEVYKIKVLKKKMRDRRMLEVYTLDGKVLRGIYCCGIYFTINLGAYGEQKFDLNNPSEFHVEEVSTTALVPETPPPPPVGEVSRASKYIQKVMIPPFTVFVFERAISWKDAIAECQSRGLQIASIHSMQENMTVVNILRQLNFPPATWHGAWIGLTDEQIEGNWQWVDGTAVDFTNFGPASGEPNGGRIENYGAIELARGGNPDGWWNDAALTEHYAAVVCRSTSAGSEVQSPIPPLSQVPAVPSPPSPVAQPSPPPLPAIPPSPPVAQPVAPMPPLPPLMPSAGVQCVDVQAEATIFNNDIPSAKAEAIARAKWEAIEKVAGVRVKAQTVVQNFRLVDDTISRQIQGVVKNYKVKNQSIQGNIITVVVNVCVERTRAFDAAGLLAMNKSVAVFLPAKVPAGYAGRFEETNILSETVIGRLAEAGVKVIDVTPLNLANVQILELALQSGSSMLVRSLMYRTLSNLLLIGKVDYTISNRKGENIGYGISMPFHHVTARLTYRLVSRDPYSGQTVILASGVEQAKGLAPNLQDAVAKALKALADRFTPVVLDKLKAYVKNLKRTVIVKVKNVHNISENFKVKEALQNTTWVTEVKEKALGEFQVSYPENPIYLANSLSQRGFKILKFTPYSITIELQQFIR